jgi:hypothetical protein
MTTNTSQLRIVREEDQFWTTSAKKVKGIRDMIKEDVLNPTKDNHRTFIVVFFDETLDNLLHLLDILETSLQDVKDNSSAFSKNYIQNNKVCLIKAETVLNPDFIHTINAYECRFIIFERHPLYSRERNLLENIAQLKNTPTVLFCGDLDEIVIDNYIEDFILTNYKSFLIQNNEALIDPKITLALSNAQKMLDEKVTEEQDATSDYEWFVKNLGKDASTPFQLSL